MLHLKEHKEGVVHDNYGHYLGSSFCSPPDLSMDGWTTTQPRNMASWMDHACSGNSICRTRLITKNNAGDNLPCIDLATPRRASPHHAPPCRTMPGRCQAGPCFEKPTPLASMSPNDTQARSAPYSTVYSMLFCAYHMLRASAQMVLHQNRPHHDLQEPQWGMFFGDRL